MKGSVGIIDIELQNFKNVKKGTLNLENKSKNYKASVLGLYGQNGSGKTALINAIQLLKYLMCGQRVPEDFVNYINIDADYARILIQFRISYPDTSEIDVWYEFSMKSFQDENTQNIDIQTTNEEKKKVRIFDEVLSFSYNGKPKPIRKNTLFDTRSSDVFAPASKYKFFFGSDAKIKQNLAVAKVLAATNSQSFIFSRALLNDLRTAEKARRDDKKLVFLKNILERMIYYGHYELFVMDTSNSGLITLNALPVSFKYHHGKKSDVGKIMLQLNEPTEIDDQSFNVIDGVISNLDVVLTQIVPGLKIQVKNLGSIVSENGKKGHRIQLMSTRNNRTIALKYESDGIKKIISVLQLLIVVYNDSSITVAIDEFDSGIFEYLLGELLRIISEKGKGQLIFTSHNLRPLETLNNGFVAFTTTNPDNRYVRLTGVKANNNLRDLYFRNIVLGGQDERLYDTTDNSEIALAFREAGEILAS
ncbi:MAG: ATP-binding protein [Lachnospiraceae bacterium]|uniref:AAA family ATPase n=1 Tax=Candidatus Weimeria bifida TaxID=2599074 RepID=A0A6N7J3G8_9FIRM|nr:AAA family ATPase [Candidatus Weimeria bifida]RRF95931.1 MAG: ATP-binding protein [Lachnospiraceae bacterium]